MSAVSMVYRHIIPISSSQQTMGTTYFSGVQLENPTTPLKILTNHRTAVDQELTGEVFNIIKARPRP